jgi:hypothetical protein
MYCATEKRKNRLIISLVTSSLLIVVCKFGHRPPEYSCTFAKIFHKWYMEARDCVHVASLYDTKTRKQGITIFSPSKCSFLHVLATSI